MLREANRLKKKKEEQSSQIFELLMCIPRNLVYVFLFVIVFAFLGMLYVIYSEQDLSYFLNGTESTVYTDLQHPLFAYFKEQLQLATFMEVIARMEAASDMQQAA